MCKLLDLGVGMAAYVCLSSSTKPPVDSYLSVYVMEALMEVLTRGTLRDVCVFVHARSRVGMGVCMCLCLPFPTFQNSYLCVCMHMNVNNGERLQLHKTLKYFALTIFSYSHTTTPCNPINMQSANSRHKETHSQNTLANCVS